MVKFFPKPKYLVVYCRGSEVESRLAHDQCALKCCDMKNDRGEHHCHRHYTMWMSIAQIETWCSDLMCFNVIHLIFFLCQHTSSNRTGRIKTTKHFFLFLWWVIKIWAYKILYLLWEFRYQPGTVVPHLQIYRASIYRVHLFTGVYSFPQI